MESISPNLKIMKNKPLPKHISLSAITAGIKCGLCHTELSLKGLLGDGEEKGLGEQIEIFIIHHANCKQLVQIQLDKSQLFAISQVTDSYEKFVIDVVEAAIKNISIK